MLYEVITLLGESGIVSIGGDAGRTLDDPNHGIEARIEKLGFPLLSNRQHGPHRKAANKHTGSDDQQRGTQDEAAIEAFPDGRQKSIFQA